VLAPLRSAPRPTCFLTQGIAMSPWMAWTSKSPAPWKNLRRPQRILPTTPFLHPPAATTSSWRLGLVAPLRWSRLAHQAPPDCVRTTLFVCVYVELMTCPMTFRSCTPMTFHPQFLTYWFLVIYEPDLACPLSTFSFISPSFGPPTPSRQPSAGWSPLDRQPNASLGWERAAG
jgi:hypothetical protein